MLDKYSEDSIANDGNIVISTCSNNKQLIMKRSETRWSNFVSQLSDTKRTGEKQNQYFDMTKPEQDQIKDVGGFVGGMLKDDRRKSKNVEQRYLLTLDADFVDCSAVEFCKKIDLMHNFAYVVYSTHKHTPDSPRLRVVIPLSRSISADEYAPIARWIAYSIGIEYFDDTTYQPSRLMYWPSSSDDAEYFFKFKDAEWLDPNEVLTKYENWKDPNEWPLSSRAKKETLVNRENKQADPLLKTGVIGAFCRCYDIHSAIQEFLPDVYEQCDHPNRYTYTSGSTYGGLVVYDDGKFAYSHHSSDPISGKLVNAFDLVRIHKFGDMDYDIHEDSAPSKLPSFSRMIDMSKELDEVKTELVNEYALIFNDNYSDQIDRNWQQGLSFARNGSIAQTIENVYLILLNDPNLKDKLCFNEFTKRIVIRGDLPWRKIGENEFWSDRDDAALELYLEKVYGLNKQAKIKTGFTTAVTKNSFHPVRNYLNELIWDGKPRVESLFSDYLGAENTDYVKTMTKKSLTAAVARIFQPGLKYDTVLVLIGPQGIGKTQILRKLGKEWFSDSLTTVQGKEAYEQLQGRWIVELGEMSATKKADVDAIKLFISKESDIYRAAYDRHVEVNKRQCVFFGTTNEHDFLRDKTGNRRFWPIKVGVREPINSVHSLTDDVVDQIWAESVWHYKSGEKIYLNDEQERLALEAQDLHLDESPKTGLVNEFLEMKLPESWDDMSTYSRREWLNGSVLEGGDNNQVGIEKRERICLTEIWCEAFGGDLKSFNAREKSELAGVMNNMKGWKKYDGGDGRLRFRNYGKQRAYVRD